MIWTSDIPPKKSGPFSVRCKLCGTIAESWHWSDGDSIPDTAAVGLAYCECGRTGADSLGVPGKGGFGLSLIHI